MITKYGKATFINEDIYSLGIYSVGCRVSNTLNSSKYKYIISMSEKIIGVSFPSELLQKLDFIRHDIPRSKYLQKLVKDNLKLMELLQ